MPKPADSPSGAVRYSLFGLIQKRPLRTALLLLAILTVLLHRPLLRVALFQSLHREASHNGLDLSATISGTPLGTCVLENLRLSRREDASSPVNTSNVEDLRIRRIELKISPLLLLRHGPGRCLVSLIADQITVQLRAREKPRPDMKEEGIPMVAVLNQLLRFPETLPDSLDIRNLNIEYRDSDGIKSALYETRINLPETGEGEFFVGAFEAGGRIPLKNLRALTRYTNRKLHLSDLRLSPTLLVEDFQMNGSRGGSASHALLSLKVCSGSGRLTFQVHPPRRSDPWQIHLTADAASGGPIADLLSLDPSKFPESLTAEADFSGTPNRPKSWAGHSKATWEQRLPNGEIASVHFGAALGGSVLRLENVEFLSPSGELKGWANLQFEALKRGFEASNGDAALEFRCWNLSQWMPEELRPNSSGTAEASFKVRLTKGILQSEASSTVTNLNAGGVKVQDCHFEATLAAPLASVLGKIDWKNVAGNGLIALEGPSFRSNVFSCSLSEAKAAVTLSDGVARLWNLQLKSPGNIASGEVSWPLDPQSPPARADLEFQLYELSNTGLAIRDARVSGSLKGRVSGGLPNGLAEGTGTLTGSNLKWGAFQLGRLHFAGECRAGVIGAQELSIGWSPDEGLTAKGSIALAPPYAYEVEGSAQFPKLDRLSALLAQSGLARHISGSMVGQLKGRGEISNLTGSGDWNLKIKDIRWDDLKLNSAECSGNYQPGLLKTAPIKITTPTTKLGAVVEWSQNTLHIQNITLEQWNTPALTGYLILPLTQDEKGIHWTEGARLAGQLRADKLDLANLFTGAGKPSYAFGTVDCSLAISGTAGNPSAAFNLRAKNMRLQSAPKFGAMELDLKGAYLSGALESEATLRSPLGSPIRAELKMPLPLDSLQKNSRGVTDLPVSLHVQTVNANLHPLSASWPGIRQISGNASVDATMRGSFNHPHWNAKFSAECPVIHFASDRAPAIGGLHFSGDFDGTHLRIQTLRADLGGGSLQVQGGATFTEPGNPLLNFTARAHEVLAVRNRFLSIRLNGDLSLKGPWRRATIGGSAAAVKSRVQRDIDVLPLTSLTPRASREQRPPGKPWFAFHHPPFSDWKFDVSLSSTPGDPILIRGNRLRGTADAELKLEGSGATPTLHGAYRSNDLVASLPFARIELSRGRVWYTRDQPFIPQIDFSAETEARNHRVRLYLSGTPDNPHISINSEPPLGETELLTLLTTGALPSDSSEGSQALASRAATVLFQEFSDKVLKPSTGERLSALRRFSLDLSAVNTRTGHQESRLTYRIQNDLFLVGEIGADGDFAGRVKYVLRFR